MTIPKPLPASFVNILCPTLIIDVWCSTWFILSVAAAILCDKNFPVAWFAWNIYSCDIQWLFQVCQQLSYICECVGSIKHNAVLYLCNCLLCLSSAN